MQKRISIITFLFFVIISSVTAQRQPPAFKKFVHLDRRDSLPYALLEPLKPVKDQKYPLVIFLHGASERGTDNEKNVKHIQILFSYNTFDKYPCYVLAPQCPKGEMWSTLMNGKPFSATPTRPMEMLIQLMTKITAQYPIDPARIYVTGVSMGGFGTWDLMARFPDRFAGAVPICGGGDVKTIDKIKHIPVWAFHGAEDPTVPAELTRKMIYALQEVGAFPGYTEYPGVGHASWHHAYKEPQLMPWLWKQKLKSKQTPP
jgi:predicted peptidase